jgi:hypothetical protein
MTSFGGVPAVAILYTNKPVAGNEIGEALFIAVSSTLGARSPFDVDFTSNIADESGALLSVLMPTWAYSATVNRKHDSVKRIIFFMVLV